MSSTVLPLTLTLMLASLRAESCLIALWILLWGSLLAPISLCGTAELWLEAPLCELGLDCAAPLVEGEVDCAPLAEGEAEELGLDDGVVLCSG